MSIVDTWLLQTRIHSPKFPRTKNEKRLITLARELEAHCEAMKLDLICYRHEYGAGSAALLNYDKFKQERG